MRKVIRHGLNVMWVLRSLPRAGINVVAFLVYASFTITMFLDEQDGGVCKIRYLWWVKMENLELSCGKYVEKFSQCDRY
jgi:hypothetical protein